MLTILRALPWSIVTQCGRGVDPAPLAEVHPGSYSQSTKLLAGLSSEGVSSLLNQVTVMAQQRTCVSIPSAGSVGVVSSVTSFFTLNS